MSLSLPYKLPLSGQTLLNPLDEATRSRDGGRKVAQLPGGRPVYFVHDPDAIKSLLNRKTREFEGEQHPYQQLVPFLPASAAQVLMHRDIGGPGARPAATDAARDRILRCADGICSGFEPFAERAEFFDVFPHVARHVISMVAELLFGVEPGELADEFFLASMQHEDSLLFSRRGADHERQTSSVSNSGQEAIQRQLQVAAAIRDAMKLESAVADDRQLRQLPHAITRTLLNGYAGISNSIAWGMYLLARHPDAHEKLLSDSSSGGSSGTYRGAVVNETLRLYPIGWMITRRCVEDAELDDVRIGRGARVSVCTYSLHRDPRLWEAAESFRPERFLAGPPAGFTFLPFSSGPHACKGSNFAVRAIEVILGSIAARFRIHADPDLTIYPFPRVALQAEPGAILRLTQRTNTPPA